MKHILIIVLSFISLSIFGQITRVDSTVIHESRSIYNSAGYYIGKDSFHVKRVRLAYCNDTFYERNDTLILRTPQRFITMDSVTGSSCPECGVPIDDLNDSLDLYVKRAANDTIFGVLYMRDKDGTPFDTNPVIYLESASAPYAITLGSNDGILLSKIGSSASNYILNDQITLTRSGEYTPISANDVLVQSEIKDLISDSIATRPTLTTVRNEISDSLATVSAPDLSNYVRKDITDTLRNLIRWGGEGWDVAIDSTGITLKNNIDFSGYNYYWNIEEGLNMNNGTGKVLAISPGVLNVTGMSGILTSDGSNLVISNGGAASVTNTYNSIQIERAGYSATGSTEVPIVSEVKALINDSLDTRLAAYTPNSDLEEKIQDQIGLKLVEGSNITLTFNDATGETTVDAAGASGLSAESVFDTVAYTIRMGEGLTKTKSDTGDSLYIEMKLRDVERLAYTTASHKLINMASNTTTGGTTLGASWALGGTNTAITKSTTNLHNFMNRAEILKSPASTSNVATIYGSTYTHGFGNASGMGGFYYVGTWGPTTGCSNTTHRGFFGFRGSVSLATDVDPSTLTNVFGIGWDDDDANVQFMHNDGSSTCTKVDLGSGFPVATADRTNVYRLFMYAEPNTTTVYYKVIDMTDGDTYVGSATTNLPSSTQLFAPCGIMSVGGTSALCGVSLFQLEIFSDF